MTITIPATVALVGATMLMATPALTTERAYRVAVAVGLVLVALGLALWWPAS